LRPVKSEVCSWFVLRTVLSCLFYRCPSRVLGGFLEDPPSRPHASFRRKREEAPGDFPTWSQLQGVVVFLALAGLYPIALRNGLPDGDVCALTFVFLVLVDLGLVLVNRSFGTSLRYLIGQRNSALIWVSTVIVLMLALILVLPFGRELFRFGSLHDDDLRLVAAVVASVVTMLEGLKRFWRTRLVR
jgi:hypothetical protein